MRQRNRSAHQRASLRRPRSSPAATASSKKPKRQEAGFSVEVIENQAKGAAAMLSRQCGASCRGAGSTNGHNADTTGSASDNKDYRKPSSPNKTGCFGAAVCLGAGKITHNLSAQYLNWFL
jgi:hypothetical protein